MSLSTRRRLEVKMKIWEIMAIAAVAVVSGFFAFREIGREIAHGCDNCNAASCENCYIAKIKKLQSAAKKDKK